MPAYRYLLCDLLTDRPLAQLPLKGVSFDRRLCRTGSLQGTLEAPNPTQVALAKLVHAYTGRAALWVYRDDQVWWGGIPWTVQATQDARGAVQASITAATFDSYAHHRRLYEDATYDQVDQGVIVPDMWRRIQADPRGGIGVIADDQPTGILRDRTYLATDHTMVGQIIEDLGDVIDGPEHTIDVYADDTGARIKRLRLANKLGQMEPRAVFQRAVSGGGRVQSWGHTADATDGGTVVQTRGDSPSGDAGEEVQPLVSTTVYRDDLLDAGWPLLDVVADYSGVTETDTLDGYAQGLAASNGGALPTSDYTVQVGNTGWTPSRLGDAVRIKITDLWHDNIDVVVRPVGCTVTAPDGDTPETIQLLLTEDD